MVNVPSNLAGNESPVLSGGFSECQELILPEYILSVPHATYPLHIVSKIVGKHRLGLGLYKGLNYRGHLPLIFTLY
jgi:hypothetical protein